MPSQSANITWLEPWRSLSLEHRVRLERELARELCASHPLAGRNTMVVGARTDRDDVLVLVDEREWVIVHLTWSRESDPRWPHLTSLPDLDGFKEQMSRDHEAYGQ